MRKVNAHTDAKAVCFLALGQRNGSLGSVAEGVGTRMSSDVEADGDACCNCTVPSLPSRSRRLRNLMLEETGMFCCVGFADVVNGV